MVGSFRTLKGRVRRLALTWLLMAGAGLGPITAGAAASSLLYYGGPVVHSPNVVLVQWGPQVRSTYTNSTSGDPGFFEYLASQNGSTADIGGVLAQYMDTTGQNSQNAFSFGGSFRIAPSVGSTPPASVPDSDIQSGLASAIGSGAIPAPSGNGLSTVYVVLFPPGDNVCFDNGGGCAYDATGGFCAYHGSFALSGSTQVLYAAMPDDGPGTPNDGYCGPSANDLQNQTSVVSHELAETINDPLVNAATGWAPPLGWYDPTYDGEIADKCDAQPLATNGPWTVEPLWSNLDGNCVARENAFSAPTASFLAPSGAQAGQPVSFDASSSTDPAQNHITALQQGVGSSFSIASGLAQYRWNWGDGSAATTASTATASHAYGAAGTYQVSLTVTDTLGFTSTTTHQVTVTNGSASPAAETDAASQVSSQQATLNGQVNPQNQTVTYTFAYGTSSSALTQTTPSTAGPAGQTAAPVSATLTGLAPSTTYYYELVVSAGAGTYTGTVRSFTTSASSGGTQLPVVATGSAARLSSSGALLTGTINPGGPTPVSYSFSYGTSRSTLGHSTPSSTLAGGTTAAPVTATLTGLRPHTRYYMQLEVSLNGQTYRGATKSFSTGRLLPRVRTGSAKDVISNSAVVSGLVDPHGMVTVYQVQFGATSSYGQSTTFVRLGPASSGERVSAVLFGLRPHTSYHYRLVAQNDGGTVVGADRTFTTARRLAAPPSFVFRSPKHASWTQLKAHRLRVRFRCSRACTAHFVLTVAPTGISQTSALPLTIARGLAQLRRSGSGRVTLRLASTSRIRRVGAQTKSLKVLLLGYAVAARSSASPPQDARITLF